MKICISEYHGKLTSFSFHIKQYFSHFFLYSLHNMAKKPEDILNIDNIINMIFMANKLDSNECFTGDRVDQIMGY